MPEEQEKRPMRQLKIDLDELARALEDSGYERQHYLDLDTGVVVSVTHETRRELEEIYEELSCEGDEEFSRFVEALRKRNFQDWQKEALLKADRVEAGFGTRYIRIPFIESHKSYGDMEEFILSLEDQRLRERLQDAIHGPGAFRRFKDVLLDCPRHRERWFQFRDAQMRTRVLDWLEEEGIQPIAQKV
jgi:Uncharacterised protein family (UPF0158)